MKLNHDVFGKNVAMTTPFEKNLQSRVIIFLSAITIATISSVSAFPLSTTFAATYSPVADEESCLALSELGATVRWDEFAFGAADCVVTGGILEVGTDDTINIDVGGRNLIIESSAEVVNNGHIALTQGGHLVFRGSNFENHGSVDIMNSGFIENVDSASFNNYGEIVLSNFGIISIYAGATGLNQGTIEINSNSLLNLGSGGDEATFTNSGIINVNQDGTIQIRTGAIFTNTCEGTLNNNGGTITNEGTIIDECNADTEAPQVTFKVQNKKGIVISDGSTTNSKDIRIEFTATDNVGVTSVECSLDGPGTRFDRQFSTCTSPIELSKLIKGTYTFTVVATDEAKNKGTYTFKWIVKQP